jgi:hypothetical protein
MEEARQALQLNHLDRAELLLERVLMLQPENAEARVELALLMARRGQADTARGLLRGLVDDPRTPPDHRARLESLLAGLMPAKWPFEALRGQARGSRPAVGDGLKVHASPAPPLWRAEASLTWSNNPLARTAQSDITFTTPDGPVQVPLANRPQPGALAGLGLARLGGESGFELHLQEAGFSGARSAARLSAWGSLPWPLPPATPPAASATSGRETWFSALQWNLQAQQGLDGARRTAAGLSALSGPWRWSILRYEEPSLTDRGSLFRVDLQALDRPRFQGSAYAERSTSTTRAQSVVRAGWQAQWTPVAGWRAQFHWQAQNDLQGYNPLLAEGAPRRLRTVKLAVERILPIGAENWLSVQALATQRQSNIELFAFREAALQVSLVRQWR